MFAVEDTQALVIYYSNPSKDSKYWLSIHF